MNAAQYLSWARPLFKASKALGAAEAFFLALPERLLDAAGEGHFLESSVSSTRGLERVKLALITADEPRDLARAPRRRDAPAKARAVRALLASLEAASGPGYDQPSAKAVLAALERWGLRGSLMLSLDFDRAAGGFDKLSLYGYLPGPPALGDLLSAFGLGPLATALGPLAGPSLAFFGVDLPPGAPAALKLYNKAALGEARLDGEARRAGSALAEAAPLRDVTVLTRVGSTAPPKSYLGFARAVPLPDLARLRLLGGPAGWLGDAARVLPGQCARFVGVGHGGCEVYFDRSGFGPAEDAE